jgi:hypothetical protein
MDEKVTKPTIETVLERMNAMEQRINERMNDMEERFGVRLDRIESVGNLTRSEMLDLRADFRELRKEIREYFAVAR